MIKHLRLLGYEIKNAFVGIKRHMILCLSAISAIALTLLLVAIVSVIGLHIQTFSSSIQKDLSIHVILDQDIESDEAIDQIKNEIEALKNVDHVDISDKDNELKLMIKEKGDVFAVYEGEENPLANAFFVYVKDTDKIAATSKQIEKLDHVDSTAYGGQSVTNLVDMLMIVQKVGFGIIILLVILSLYLIYNTIRTTIDSRQEEIMIMRTVGATNAFVSRPFMIEGIILSLLGALIPVLCLYFGYQKLYIYLEGQLFTPLFKLMTLHDVTLYVGISILIVAMLIGGIASELAVHHYLKKQR